MVFFNSDTHLKIELPIEQLNIMHNLCDKSNPYETGGILIGSYSDDNLMLYNKT